MPGYDIRQNLRSGRRVYASAMISPSTMWPKWYAKVGIDFIFVDSEHTPLGRESLSWLCQAFAAYHIPPVVRIPCPDPFEACKVLDGGAGGFIAPYIETPEQVRQLMGVARYRPLNERPAIAGRAGRSHDFGARAADLPGRAEQAHAVHRQH
jgi:4-hydroxy-2-oxoheptanedioate aldolase